MANRRNYSKISTEGAKAKPTEEAKVESTLEAEATEKVESKPEVKIIKGVIVNCERLNVRKEPNINSEVLAILDKGTAVTIYGEENEFYKISHAGEYCMKKYISVQK